MTTYVRRAAALCVLVIAAIAPATAAEARPAQKSTRPGPFVFDNGYSQHGSLGWVSDNYVDPLVADESSEGADDFTLSRRTTINEVAVYGFYHQNSNPTAGAISLDSGPADSVTVRFYGASIVNGVAVPGGLIEEQTVTPTDLRDPRFVLTISPITLSAGHYWVSVVANINYTLHGDWRWSDTPVWTLQGAEAVWRQPSDAAGTGCATWCTLATAYPSASSNGLNFRLTGTTV